MVPAMLVQHEQRAAWLASLPMPNYLAPKTCNKCLMAAMCASMKVHLEVVRKQALERGTNSSS